MTAQVVTNTIHNGSKYIEVIIDWAATDAGAVSYAIPGIYEGLLWKCVIIPDSGDTAPAAGYDVTITDADGLDILCGGGADCSATAAEYISASDLGVVVNSALTLTIAAAGDAKGGKIYLFIERS